MSSIPDIADLAGLPRDCEPRDDRIPPAGPFTSLRYHFGMLLGVDDFETEQDYQRGKMRLHNAWLHREGVVWGFAVEADVPRGELRVGPGLALDAAGRELHLDAAACLDVAAWYAAHEDELTGSITETDGLIELEAWVELRFRSCLTRPVPALADPCEGGATDTAFSREFETVELNLVGGTPPARSEPYHRLRLLFGLADPVEEGGTVVADDQEVLDERARIAGLAEDQQPLELLAAFRRFAALDARDLEPAETPDGSDTTLFPGSDDAPIPLAAVHVALRRSGDGLVLDAATTVDETVRPAHVATATIQELLCGRLGVTAGGGGGGGGAPAASSAPGPQVDRETVTVEERTITFVADRPLQAASAEFTDAYRVSSLSDAGWKHVKVSRANYEAQASKVTLSLRADPGGDLVRLVVRGTGINPVVGVDFVPLAGAVGEAPGTEHEGRDFVHMLRRSA